jgi:hypothetical protein
MAQFQTATQMNLGQAALTTSVATLYTSPNLTLTSVQDITVSNTNSTAANFSVYLVPVTKTASSANAIFYQCALLANQTVQWTGNQILSAGWTIQAQASTTGLTISVSGEQFV